MRKLRSALFVALLCPAAGCAHAARQAVLTTPPPDAGKRVVAEHGAVSSANPLASAAGVSILRAGGNAVDAAVATAFAIGVVEPQMSGLGGSGAAVVYIAKEKKAYDLDFYASQNSASFRGHTGRPYPPGDLRVVGIPGDVAGLVELHDRFGRLPLAQVMAPAVRLAEDGFPVGQILAQMIVEDSAKLRRFPAAYAHFWPDGKPLAEGQVLRNPELAASLRLVAAKGKDGFYTGPLAEKVVATLNAGGHPATPSDLADYRTRWERPVCAEYHGRTILSAAPPQTGMQVLHTLELLEPFDLPKLGLPTRSAAAFDVLTSALRVGMADARVNDDPNWSPVPAAGVVSEGYAAERRALVGKGSAPDSILPGDARPFDAAPPPAACAPYQPYGPAQPVPAAGATSGPGASSNGGYGGAETTHMSIVDQDGNAVALTQTNSDVFGSGAWVAGFMLNDSGFRFTDENLDAPSRSPWRTRITTISPTVVLDGDGRVRMVVGAPGGGRIPTEILQVMVYVMDYGMDPLEAVRMPRMYPSPRSPRVQLEHGFPAALLRDVRAMGYEPVMPEPEYARLYIIVRGADGRWIAVADPRHDGEPRGY